MTYLNFKERCGWGKAKSQVPKLLAVRADLAKVSHVIALGLWDLDEDHPQAFHLARLGSHILGKGLWPVC